MRKLVVAAVATVAVVGGCAALTTGGTSSTSVPADETSESAAPKEGVTGNWRVIGTPQPKREQFTGDYTMAFRAENVSGAPATAMFQVSVVKGDELLGSLDCIGTGNETAAGATTKVDCTSLDKFKPGWTSVEIEDSGF